jgi:coenzyme Q-binding protein COQ10
VVIEEIGRLLPCSRQQAFDLAADIERYPEFLPGWISARIQTREVNVWHVDQVMGIGPVRVQFVSRAALHRPERIDVTSSEPPFRQFSLVWRFEAAPTGAGCRVWLSAAVELRSRMLQRIVERVLPTIIVDAIAAFEARANLGALPPLH